MKLAIIGATGNVGTRLVDEALKRHHAVTGIARDPSKLAPRTGLSAAPETSRGPIRYSPC
ncbi:MAG TPA: NAD(P)H-binding protein [Steroidobacteraceae bacterium]|nr:NAD(P)H-binding protein [Steroidobacteraceae bacterium]